MNIVDPIFPTNNLGKSVNFHNFSKIKKVFEYAASSNNDLIKTFNKMFTINSTSNSSLTNNVNNNLTTSMNNLSLNANSSNSFPSNQFNNEMKNNLSNFVWPSK